MSENEPFTAKERLTYALIGLALIIALAMLWSGNSNLDVASIASLLAAFGFGVALPSPLSKV